MLTMQKESSTATQAGRAFKVLSMEGTAVALPMTRNLRAAPEQCKGRCDGRAP